MKQAVILVGGKQYIAREGETLRVDLLPAGTKELETGALLLIDGDKTKLRIIHFKAKKRELKRTGHRQKYSLIKIESIK